MTLKCGYCGNYKPEALAEFGVTMKAVPTGAAIPAGELRPHGDMSFTEEVAWRREREKQMLASMAAQGRWIERLNAEVARLTELLTDACETESNCRALLKPYDKSDSLGIVPLVEVITIALEDLKQKGN